MIGFLGQPEFSSNRFVKKLVDYENPDSLGSRLRNRRNQYLIHLIEKISKKDNRVKILDVGGRITYWKFLSSEFLEKNNVEIYVLNLPGETSGKFVLPQRFHLLDGDACDLGEFNDYSFDLIHSNSVVEHVGSWNNMLKFSEEVKRLSPNYYIQTPNFWFPIEPHFMFPILHWLPLPMRIFLITHFSLGNHQCYASVSDAAKTLQHYQLLDRLMMQSLFPEAKLHPERFLGLVKSWTAIQISELL